MPIIFAQPVTPGNPWDLSSASYDSVSMSTLTEDQPGSITFSSDGTKAYIGGTINHTVYQYTLSTPWDLSTGVYSTKSADVSSEVFDPSGVAFKSDGTKMYVSSRGFATVYQYSLSTAWDVSSYSYDSVSKSVSSQDVSPHDVFFNPDGSIMYIAGDANDTIFQYALGTNWDLSTASYSSISFAETHDTALFGMFISPDGTKLFTAGQSNDTVYQYTLGTPWLISSATYDSVSFDIQTIDSGLTGVAFKTDGTKMYSSGAINKAIYQYSL